MISFVILAALVNFGNTNPIVNGKDVSKPNKMFNKEIVKNDGKYSFVVFLEIVTRIEEDKYEAISNCGGTIIRKDVILTAAHCLAGYSVDPTVVYVWGGILDRKKQKGQGQQIPAHKYTIHKDYNRRSQEVSKNDIALVWLSKPFDLNGKNLKVATLPESGSNFENKYGWVVGWGYTACDEPSATLQKARLKIVKTSKCEKFFPQISFKSNTLICALSDDGKSGHHYGDSGGPLVVEGKVVGVISFSEKLIRFDKHGKRISKCDTSKPGVSTDVSKFIAWINEQLKSHGK